MLFIRFRAWLHPQNFNFIDYQLAILTAKDFESDLAALEPVLRSS
jgi:hypothetical protein